MPASSVRSADIEKTRIILGLLESVHSGKAPSQRVLASELGIALGLVNTYLKRCISKGLVKVGSAPARRYAYYLTPRGFAEKSRLTVEYLSYSFSLFRQAKADCLAALQMARSHGVQRIALIGISDFAEIAAICALDSGISIVAVIDPAHDQPRFAGVPVKHTFDEVGDEFEAVLVTNVTDTLATIEAAVAKFGSERVLVPVLLERRSLPETGAA
jgi:hypothetical protein